MTATAAPPPRTAPAGLVALRDVPSLETPTILDWHRRHLNPALIDLMALGGYDQVRIARAEGPYLYTHDGRKLLDLVSSYGALNFGHNHPRLLAAARWFDAQLQPDLLKEFPSPYTGALAHNLASIAPEGLETAFFCNSGAESIEGAMKLALRSFGGARDRFAYARDSLHGKTLGTLSITGREKYREHVRRFEDWPMVDFGDIASLEAVLGADRERRIAALVLEPIQGEGGVVVPPPGYLAAARELTRRHGALLIADEVQTGFGRTGSMFRCQAEGVVPDILCVAKSLGGGVATIGATLTRPELWRQAYGKINHCLVHTSTFGGRARSCALAIEAVAVTCEEDLPGRAAELGAWLRVELERLREKYPRQITGVRGAGLMLGLELAVPRLDGLATPLGVAGLNRILESYFPGIVGAELLARHDIVASFVLNNPRVLRLYPALVATRADLERIPIALDAVFARGVNALVAERVAHVVRHAGPGALARWLRDW